MNSTVMIAATGSKRGKTTFVTGLLRAYKDKDNKTIHAFKCGPDYIDPMFHRDVLSIPSTNLDSYFLDEDTLRTVFSENAGELNVIEAAMGLYDGIGTTMKTSAYEIAVTLGCKIILLVDGSGMGYSIIPLIRGFALSDKEKLISGIVINRISEKFYNRIAPVIEEELGIKVLGFMPKIKDAELPSRHLGLVSPEESDFINKVSLIKSQVVKSVDIEKILEIGEESECNKTNSFGIEETYVKNEALKNKKILVARDEAFSFCYEENIKLLKALGANIQYFSPIHDKHICEDADVIILYGGYPENYAKDLSENIEMIESIRNALDGKAKVLAECGGFMYLLDSLEVDGEDYKMTGIIKGYSKKSAGLIRFGYVNIKGDDINEAIKAHEFHHYEAYEVDYSDDYIVKNESSSNTYKGIVKRSNVFAGFPHLYYLSNPEFIIRILND